MRATEIVGSGRCRIGIGQEIWASAMEIMRQLELENPDATDEELLKLLVRELTESISKPEQ
jgi:hypothetical protein